MSKGRLGRILFLGFYTPQADLAVIQSYLIFQSRSVSFEKLAMSRGGIACKQHTGTDSLCVLSLSKSLLSGTNCDSHWCIDRTV
jgi:hypothetical protein